MYTSRCTCTNLLTPYKPLHHTNHYTIQAACVCTSVCARIQARVHHTSHCVCVQATVTVQSHVCVYKPLCVYKPCATIQAVCLRDTEPTTPEASELHHTSRCTVLCHCSIYKPLHQYKQTASVQAAAPVQAGCLPYKPLLHTSRYTIQAAAPYKPLHSIQAARHPYKPLHPTSCWLTPYKPLHHTSRYTLQAS